MLANKNNDTDLASNTKAGLNLEGLKKVRKAKYQLKKQLKAIDLGKSCFGQQKNIGKTSKIAIRLFEVEALKVGILLQNKDMDLICKKFTDPKNPSHILYEEVLKVLVPVFGERGLIRWSLSTQVTKNKEQNDKIENSIQKTQIPTRYHQTQIHSTRQSIMDLKKSHSQQGSVVRNEISPQQQIVTSEELLSKLLKASPQQTGDSYWKRDISSGSKDLIIYKNKEHSKYIKAAFANSFDPIEKDRIRRFLKKDNIDIKSLNQVRSAFLSCDQQKSGLVKKHDFIKKLVNKNLQFPQEFFLSLLEVIQVDKTDKNEEALLSYAKMRSVIDIFNQCPARLKGDNNNSDNFKMSIEHVTDMKHIAKDRTEKMIRFIHMRLEEKFRDYRHAFRSFDTNYDGTLSFKEFMTGLENMGVRLDLQDFKKIYETLDYNNSGCIDFNKFCLLNTDRSLDIHNLIHEIQNKNEGLSFVEQTFSKKPPLHSMRPGTAVSFQQRGYKVSFKYIPKNKDLNKFNQEVQEISHSEFCKKKRRSQDVPSSRNQDFIYGSKNEIQHNMVALIGNQYVYDNDNFSQNGSLKKFRSPIITKPPRIEYKHVKGTASQKMREDAIINKFSWALPKKFASKFESKDGSRKLRISTSLPRPQGHDKIHIATPL